MKTRNGFVSNSSTSSFICDISGCVIVSDHGGNMDGDIAECLKCSSSFLLKYIVTPDIKTLSDEDIKDIISEDRFVDQADFDPDEINDRAELERLFGEFIAHINNEYSDGHYYSLSHHLCPVCAMKKLPKELLFSYLLKKAGLTNKALTKQIKLEFGTFEKFKEFLDASE